MLSTVQEKESRELGHGHRFYQRMAELQEKLRKSEEERLKLEENFRILMRSCREEEDAKLTMLKAKYETFLDDEKKRRERNDRILQTLDRIESRTVMLTSKSERLQLMRRHYEAYLASMYPAWTDNHQGQMANKLKMTPVMPNSRYANLDSKLTSDINKESHFPLTPVKGAVYTPSYLPNPAIDQRVSMAMGYSSIQPLVNTNPLETLGLSQQSPHQEYSLSGQHRTPSHTPSYQQFSPYNQIIPNSFSNIPKTLPLQYTRGVPTFSSPDLKHQELFQSSPPEKLDPYSHHTSAAQNAPQELIGNTLLSDSFRFRDKHTLPSSANTVEENQQIIKSDELPHNKSVLSDCISNAAELLNYNVKGAHGLHSITHHGVEESKLAMSLDNELEQNTSGDPLCISLSDDGISNQEEALNNEALLEATPGRNEVSNHIGITSNTFGVSPVCKETTVENSVPVVIGVKGANVKQDAEVGAPVITGQNLNILYGKKAEMIGETRTSLSDNDLTNVDGRLSSTNGMNVKGRPSEYGQGDAVDVVKGNENQEAEYGLSNINNKGNEICDKLPREHTSEHVYPQNNDKYSVDAYPEDYPLASNNNRSSNHDNFIGGEELNSNTENNVPVYDNSLQHQDLQTNSANEEANRNNYQTGEVYEEQQEYGADSRQATVTGQAYEEQPQQDYGADNVDGYIESKQADESNYVTGQPYVEQQQQEYAADDQQVYVEDEHGNENNYVTEQAYDEHLQQEYAADDGQGYVEDVQGNENHYTAGQVYDEQQQQEYAADDGQGYVDNGQGNENNYVTEQAYDEQLQHEYAAGDGQGNVNNYEMGQVYDEQQQLEYVADNGQGYVEDGQGNGSYVTGQAYEEHGADGVASEDRTEGQYISEENPLGDYYTQSGDQQDIGAFIGDNQQIDQGDQQYFQGGKYHEPTVGYETGNVSNSEEIIRENTVGGAGVCNEISTDSINKLSEPQKEDSPDGPNDPPSNIMAEQLTEFQQEIDSKLLEQSSKSRDNMLDNSENNTSTSSSEFNKQNESNELEPDMNSTKVSIEGDGTRITDSYGENVIDRTPLKPKMPGLAMLESDSDSAVLDTVGMPNDDSDFDFSENK